MMMIYFFDSAWLHWHITYLQRDIHYRFLSIAQSLSGLKVEIRTSLKEGYKVRQFIREIFHPHSKFWKFFQPPYNFSLLIELFKTIRSPQTHFYTCYKIYDLNPIPNCYQSPINVQSKFELCLYIIYSLGNRGVVQNLQII